MTIYIVNNFTLQTCNAFHTVEDDGHHQIRHQSSFRIMHEVPVTDPFFGIPSNLTFLTLDKLPRHEPLAIMVNEVLNDKSGLCQHKRLGKGFGLNYEYGSFSKWMDFFPFWRCLSVQSFKCFDLVFEIQLFQQP